MFTINSKHTQFIHLYVCVSCLFEIHSYASRNKCFLNLVVVVVVGAPRNGTIYAYINYSLKTEFHHFTISLEQLCVKAKKSCFEIKRRKNGKPNDAVAEGRRGGGEMLLVRTEYVRDNMKDIYANNTKIAVSCVSHTLRVFYNTVILHFTVCWNVISIRMFINSAYKHT